MPVSLFSAHLSPLAGRGRIASLDAIRVRGTSPRVRARAAALLTPSGLPRGGALPCSAAPQFLPRSSERPLRQYPCRRLDDFLASRVNRKIIRLQLLFVGHGATLLGCRGNARSRVMIPSRAISHSPPSGAQGDTGGPLLHRQLLRWFTCGEQCGCIRRRTASESVPTSGDRGCPEIEPDERICGRSRHRGLGSGTPVPGPNRRLV